MLRFTFRRFYSSIQVLNTLPSVETIKSKFTFSREAKSIQQILNSSNSGSYVTINGWIDRKPRKVSKSLIFGTLRDHNGDMIQLLDSHALLKQAQVEDAVQVEGELVPIKNSHLNDSVKFEIKLITLRCLNRSNVKPSQLQEFKIEGNYPPEYRYLQLRLPKFQKNLKNRYKITKIIREKFDDLEFIEVETPLLFKSTPEGAREFLVPTRNKINNQPAFYALPQSPQQYKQLLMASGVSRYFQFARCFRDEDLRSDRQPEFTQVDIEMSFATAKDIMHVVEDITSGVWNKISENNPLQTIDCNEKIVPVSKCQNITKLTYQQVMMKYGIDKPDLRFPDLKILDLSDFNVNGHINKDFPVFEVLILRNAFKSEEDLKKNWSMLSNSHEYNYRTPIIVPIVNEAMEYSWFERFSSIASFENPKLVSKFINLKKGDIICGSTRQNIHRLFENPTPLGKLRQLVIQSDRGKELYQRTTGSVAAWIIDFPLFSPVEAKLNTTRKSDYPVYIQNKKSATHHPFTMVQLPDYMKLKTDPLSCLGQHYDLVVNGIELGGGSVRIHDPELQEYIFKQILDVNCPEKTFGHLLNAFQMGTPPHAGFAIGFDRMCAMLSGTNSIRDVIPFPKSITGSDLVVGSPSCVAGRTLEEYNLASLVFDK